MITNTEITTTDTDIYTSVNTTAVTTMIFCNIGTPNPSNETENAVQLELHLVKQGNVATNANTIVKNLNIPAGETVFFDTERVVLDNGDKIIAIASSNSLLVSTVSALAV